MRPPIHYALVVAAALLFARLAGSADTLAFQAPPRAEAVARFLSSEDRSLVSYRAVRRLTAESRGGKMRASLTAMTTFDSERGFQYEVLAEEGSGMIRSRVLRGALEAERDARRRDQAGRSALSEANYEFGPGAISAGLVQVTINPRRKDAMLIDGSIFLTPEDADLVRIEGLLVKRPSFWTRRVEVVRRYARLAGVRVPVAMSSVADVLLAGRSTFSMDYEYQSINGTPLPKSPTVQ